MIFLWVSGIKGIGAAKSGAKKSLVVVVVQDGTRLSCGDPYEPRLAIITDVSFLQTSL